MCFSKLFGKSKPVPTGNGFQIGYGQEVTSPQSIFRQGALAYNPATGKVELDLSNLSLSDIPWTTPPLPWIIGVPDSNSMDPVIDLPDDVCYLRPATLEDHQILCDFIKPGDHLVYQNMDWNPGQTVIIIHAVEKIEYDTQGRKFLFQGVNNPTTDPGFARDEDIMAILAVIVH